MAHERLRGKVRYAPVGFELLPPRFSLTQLQRLYEMILGTELDKRNFRKKILAMDLLVETDEVEQGVRHRAARLYRFDRRKYDRLDQAGLRVRDVSKPSRAIWCRIADHEARNVSTIEACAR